MYTSLEIAFLLLTTIPLSKCWDLQYFGITPNYYVSSIAIHRYRVFVTLPRKVCFNNATTPTFLELPWSGPIKSKTLINQAKKQTWGVCEDIQNAVDLEIDHKKARLWVLDRGNEACSSKLLIFNLNLNQLFGTYNLEEVSSGKLSSLVLDRQHEPVAYIGGLENKLVVFSFGEKKSWALQLRAKHGSMLISTGSLAISKADDELFITGTKSEDLFSVNVRHILEIEQDANKSEEANVTVRVNWLGQKLGPSGGITVDNKNGLIYYLIRDYAVVRWDTRKALQAEYHTILYQYFPYVSDISVAPQGGIFVLVNPFSPEDCRNMYFKENSAGLGTRMHKLPKHYTAENLHWFHKKF